MGKLLKAWAATRGYKRQAGAIMAIVPIICSLFGIEIPRTTYDALVTMGSLIWGIGWTDRGARELQDRMQAGRK